MSLAEVKEELPAEKILISNMEGNGYKYVVKTIRGNFQPFEKKDKILVSHKNMSTKFDHTIEYLEGEISVFEEFKKRAFKKRDAKIIEGQIEEMKKAINILKRGA